ncbi:MAG: TonB-dependent receptor [Chitinophagaceae bacterium]|nr:TonB-dependent receptor [Chitinophagaceae bacterium]
MRITKKYLSVIFLLCLAAIRLPAQKNSMLYRPFRSHLQKGAIKDFLDEINMRSGIQVEYASVSFPPGKIVSLNNDVLTLGALLQQVLAGEKVKAIEKNDKIILIPSDVPLADDALLPLYSFFGIIGEEGSLEPLHDAVIYEPSTRKATVTNVHGYFSLQLPEGRHLLEVTYAGYKSRQVEITLHWDLRSDVFMTRKEDIPEVIVSAADEVKKNGTDKILPGQYSAYNNILGENDVLRSLFILPGVINATDATNGLLVRGGEQDGNLFLLDGNPVFNPTHMLGALSIVNKTSMRSMQLFKNDFPSRYGGRLSSVIDVNTKDGNMEKWGGEANLNFLAGSFTVEGPLKKNKTAVMLSFRHSMFTSVLDLFQKDFDNNFYDIQFKCTHLLDKNNKLMLNLYSGIDNLNLQISNNNLNNRQRWGNRIASLGWTHLLSSNAFITTTLSTSNYYNLAGFIYTNYDDSTGQPIARRSFNTYSSLAHYAARTQLEMRMTNAVKLNFGGEFAYTRIKPFESKIDSTIAIDPASFQSSTPLPFKEVTLYSEMDLAINKHFLLRPGIHFSKYRFRDYQFTSIQPRLYAVYKLSATGQIYASYSRMTQYLHLLTNPSLGINSDTWVPSTGLLDPEDSRSLDLGYTFKKKDISFTLGGYWKKMYNVTNYTEGKSFFINTDSTWEQNVQTGKGWSYGMEFMGEKSGRKLNVHIAYTLSWSWRKFDQINQGKKFPFKYDRRHNLNVAVTYKADKTKDISLLWMIASGDLFTLPEKIYPDFDNAQQISSPNDLLKSYRFIYHFGGINDYRTRPYHRLDLSASYHPPRKKRFGFNWTAGVYNVYGSPGQYSYGLEGSLHSKSLVIIMKNQLFNITPYLSTTVDF